MKVILGYICVSWPFAYVDHCFRNGQWST